MAGLGYLQPGPARRNAAGDRAASPHAPAGIMLGTRTRAPDGAVAISPAPSRERSLLHLQAALDARLPIQGQLAQQRTLNERGLPRGLADFAAGDVRSRSRAYPAGLPPRLQAGIEHLSGLAMNDVRVHYNSPKPAAVHAHAFAQGAEIHLAAGQERHLPHEAWHVVQQRQGRVKPTLQLKGIAVNDDGHLEREADVMGARAQALGTARGIAGGRIVAPAQAIRALAAQRVASGPVLQRTTLNLDKADKISGISDWRSRPSSNTTGQGQHLTAYVAFEDMILSHVRGCSIAEAAGQLTVVIDMIRTLPGTEHLHRDYVRAFDNCKADLTKAAAMRDQKAAKETVEAVIDEILSLRNKLPDTALSTSEKTPGHGEATSSGGLEVMENTLRKGKPFPKGWGDEKAIATSLLSHMWRLLDYQPSSQASAEAFAKTKQRVLRHVMQMRLSYPRVWKWLTERGYDLMAYLAKNRQNDGMPLSELSNGEVATLSSHVADNTSDEADEKMADAGATSVGPSQHTRSRTKAAAKGGDAMES